jgi:hypothetical protein
MEGPYMRLLFAIIATEGNWSAVLDVTDLPLNMGLFIALRFLGHKAFFFNTRIWLIMCLNGQSVL